MRMVHYSRSVPACSLPNAIHCLLIHRVRAPGRGEVCAVLSTPCFLPDGATSDQ